MLSTCITQEDVSIRIDIIQRKSKEARVTRTYVYMYEYIYILEFLVRTHSHARFAETISSIKNLRPLSVVLLRK